ncbi:hypothetical protein OAT67_09015 [Bacteriovoracaceae bacterium]|nr:hypothetical protein [Bacteriovoracaceae bacterium]|tara:strand:- start:125544 stop:126077 length:534 start_codon:yes stop_codon:yes gene_type:complete
MRTILLALLLLGLTLTTHAKRVKCTYYERYQYQSGKKIKFRKSKLVEVKAKLDMSEGGTIKVSSDYMFGALKQQTFKVYNSNRPQEKKYSYVKFHNKTPAQSKSNEWIPTYIRFSVPKAFFKGKKRSGFKAYLGYFVSQTNFDSIDGSLKGVTLSDSEKDTFKRENAGELEYELDCN